MGAELIAAAGVVLAAVIAFFTARTTANKTLAGTQATNDVKRGELDQGYVKWACDLVIKGNDEEARTGVVVLRALKDGNQLQPQERTVVIAVLRAYTNEITR